jgi:hypothetical protein
LRRILLLLSLGVLLVGIGAAGRPSAVAHGASVDKKTCKTATKKIHGKKKKVTVCTTTKVKPTAIPTVTKPTAAPTVTNTPTTMFGSAWSNGTSGWTQGGSGAWAVNGGVLTYDGTSGSSFIAPFVASQANYFVQATIQIVKLNDSPNVVNGAGLLIRAPGALDLSDNTYGNHSVLVAGAFQSFDHRPNPNPALSQFLAGITSPDSLSTDVLYVNTETTTFTPNNDYHLYRLEVRDNDIRLLIDGHTAVEVQQNLYFSQTKIGLFSLGDQVNVKDFEAGPLS